ncbi:hypothetical protein M9H77_11512 [Catharanthus roseus]|uniref:Uncharacterized protein n=1 Tax=Catharanthus roseus TaxID=4058 RepID=A0ACC0BEU7_CATRO|nr:hypothetical protein M9H77_11512 [Catharanthus roseus]
MDSKTKDVVEDLRSHTTKFSYMHNPGQNKKVSSSLSNEVKREHVHKRMEDEDSDFLKYLNAEYMSIVDDPKPEFLIDCGDDPSYALFLSSLKNDGSSYVLEDNQKNWVNKATKSKDVNNHCGCPQQTMCSNFRVQILEILRKPYDKEEREKLMQEITKQNPQDKHRDLHSGGLKFCPSHKRGKSLFDHYLVLKRKSEETVAANNHLKQLNLLRGFFFWLQLTKTVLAGGRKNLTDDESFIPWNDKECVDVQPEGSSGFNCLIP